VSEGRELWFHKCPVCGEVSDDPADAIAHLEGHLEEKRGGEKGRCKEVSGGGVVPMWMRILRVLSTGPKAVRELCRCLFPSSPVTVEKHVGWLVDKGLVEELRVSSTGKPRILKLTERGARVASMVVQILAEIEG
jgi:hypothetical protein